MTTSDSVVVGDSIPSSPVYFPTQIDPDVRHAETSRSVESLAKDSPVSQRNHTSPVTQQIAMWFTWDRLALAAKMTYLADVFSPMKITIQAGVEPEPLEIHAVPHLTVRGRFFDGKGMPCRGHEQYLHALDNGQPLFLKSTPVAADGWFEWKIPKGVDDIRVSLTTNEHSSMRWRKSAEYPLRLTTQINLGKIDEDFTTREVVRYEAPILLLKPVDQNGELLSGFNAFSKYAILPTDDIADFFLSDGGGIHFEEQPDGRWRSSNMLPDDDVTIWPRLTGYTSEPKTVSLKEGETRELVFTMTKTTQRK